MTETRWRRAVPLALFFAITIASLAPIRNYDLFWHLATGRWIVEHGALPATDPFAVASDRHAWINGEWLFQIVLYLIHSVVGVAGLSIIRGVFAGALFTAVYEFARRKTEAHVALLLTAIAYAGAMETFDLRPSAAAIVFLVGAIVLGERRSRWLKRTDAPVIEYALLTVAWVNIHPSAVIAPAIALLATRRILPLLASAAALLVNPYGIRAVLAPLELTLFATSGAFVNAEWLPSTPVRFPLLYVCIIAGLAVVAAVRREQSAIARASRILLFLMLAFLAVRHVRNQALFFAAFPILVAPDLGAIAQRLRPAIAYAVAIFALVVTAATGDHRLGVAPERFPLQAVARLKASGLEGNIYNPDQFGGFLIWSFYPHRRALTDGRNELYRSFIPEYAHAREDERLWRALLRKYRIDIAVDEYRPPLQVTNAATRETASLPASLAYWPRSEWALIAFDEAAMVFARRAAFTSDELRRWEIRDVVPDAPLRR